MELRTILYGYRKEFRSYYIVPEEAKAVRRIFADYISGKSLKSIADALSGQNDVDKKRGQSDHRERALCRGFRVSCYYF